MLLFAAFQVLCTKLFQWCMEIETFNGVLEEKDNCCLFLVRYSPEEDIFVAYEMKVFRLGIFWDYKLAL